MDMQKEKILEILNDWNFWQKHPFVGIKRDDLLRDIAQLNYKSFAISIIGPRRSGKSILIKQLAEKLIDEGVSSRNILIVNLEDYRWQNLDLALLDEVYSIYLDEINISDKPYIFLDEIHRVPQWERFVRTILEKKEASFFVSGSSAKLLSKELATLLTGRNLVVEVLPLSFKEFLKFNNIEIKEVLDVITGKKEILNLFKKYLEWGGFPEVVLSEGKMAILCQYFEDILEKDVTARYEVRRKDKLNTLAKFYLSNISNLITFRKIEKFLKIPLVTIERFSSYLQDAYLIFFIKKFSFSLKEQDNSPRKVYSYDVGIANAIGFEFSQNIGRIYENIVAVELRRQMSKNKKMEIFYWQAKGGEETDFVIKEGLKVNQLIQVTTNIDGFGVKERETKGLRKALNEFKLERGLIITEAYEADEDFGGKKIKFIPLWKWLLQG